MTSKRLRAALKAWTATGGCETSTDERDELLAAWAAEPKDTPLEVGQRVRVCGSIEVARVLQIDDDDGVWIADNDGNSILETATRYDAGSVEPIPGPPDTPDVKSERDTSFDHLPHSSEILDDPDTETQEADEIGVGDTVTQADPLTDQSTGTVVGVYGDGPVNIWVTFPWTPGGATAYPARELTKLPPPLPDDSLERHWVVGAWIVHPGQTFIVLDEQEALEIQRGETAYPKHARERLREWGTGWSFHESSPVKEKRDAKR